MGQYSALVAAGALDLADAVRLVRRRGELMQASGAGREGRMAAIIGLDDARLPDLVARPRPTACSGSRTATRRARSWSRASGRRSRPRSRIARELGAKRAIELPVSVAAHSPLMAEAAEGMRATLAGIAFHDPRPPLLANADARPITTADGCRAELVDHLTTGVDWVGAIEAMRAAGVTTFIEVGPGRVLTGLIKRIAPDAVALALDDPAAADRLAIPFADSAAVEAATDPPSDRQPTDPRGTPCVNPISPAASSSPASASSVPSATTRTPPGTTWSTAAPVSTTITKFDTERYDAQLGRRGPGLRRHATGWTRRRSGAARPPCGTASRQPSRPSRTRGLEINDANREDIGVVFGTGAGGQTLMIENGDVLREKGPSRVAPTFIANGLVDSTSGMIAIETGAIGHNICVVTACSTGTNCVGEGAEIIRRGDVHTVIAGSSEMPLLEVAHAGFGNMRGLGRRAPGSR